MPSDVRLSLIWKACHLDDLDPKKWPSLLDHPLLKEIFSGGSGSNANLIAGDYNIDSHELSDLPLIWMLIHHNTVPLLTFCRAKTW